MRYEELVRNRSINIKNLFMYLIGKWKQIVIVSIICLLVSSVIAVVDFFKTDEAIEEGQLQEAVLTEDDIFNVEKAREIENRIIQRQYYVDNAVRMQLDSYNVDTLTMIYQIVPEDETIESIINSCSTTKVYKEKLDAYINSRMYLESLEAEGILDVASLISINVETESNIIEIKIIHLNKDNCEKIANKIRSQLVEWNEILEAEQHLSFVEVDSVYKRANNEAVRSHQEAVYNDLYNNKERLTSIMNGMSKVQKDVFLGVETKTEIPQENGFNFTIVILGLIAGAVGTIFVYAAYFIISDKVFFGNEIGEVFEIPLLGEVEKGNNLLENRLHNICAKQNIKELGIYVDQDSSVEDTEIDDLIKELEKKHIKAIVLRKDKLSNESDKLNLLKNLVIVAYLHKTHMLDLAKNLDVISEFDLEINGVMIRKK